MTSSNGTISALLAICVGNSPVPGEFPAQRPVTRSFDVFFDLRLNKRLSKQSWVWWFETPSRPIWRHRNGALFCLGFITRSPLYQHNWTPIPAWISNRMDKWFHPTFPNGCNYPSWDQSQSMSVKGPLVLGIREIHSFIIFKVASLLLGLVQ